VPFPVEYKLGKPKIDKCDEVQLCAQAICLGETLETNVEHGAIFYGRTRRRKEVVFDRDLRDLTADTAQKFHELFEKGITPPAEYNSKKCSACSLFQLCLPKLNKLKLNSYMDGVFNEKDA
jgi:CRISPR-associated exonuclease Cas4